MRSGQVRLIIAFALSLLPCSLSAEAQQPTKIPLIGILSDQSLLLCAKTFDFFLQGLHDLGWVVVRTSSSTGVMLRETTRSFPTLLASWVRAVALAGLSDGAASPRGAG